MLILAAPSIGEAKGVVEADPFIRRGYYAEFEIHEFVEANEGNNWQMDNVQTRGNMTDAPRKPQGSHPVK